MAGVFHFQPGEPGFESHGAVLNQGQDCSFYIAPGHSTVSNQFALIS